MTGAYADKRVLVVGASGFIGRWVALKLKEAGAETFLVVRDTTGSAQLFERWGIEGEIVEADLCRSGTAAEIIRCVRPSITFNLAGYGVDTSERDEGLADRINAAIPRELCEAAAQYRNASWAGQSIVHAGSALEYGNVGGNLDEDGPANPTTVYGKTKLAGTQTVAQVCRRCDVRGLTARLFTVYGPGEHPGRLLPCLLEAARTGASLDLTAGTQQRDFTYVEDVAEGLLRLGTAEAEPGVSLNLATGRLRTVRSFAEIAARVLEIPESNLRFGAIPTRAKEMAHHSVSTQRLKALTHWIPSIGVDEGVRRTIAKPELL